MGGPRPPVPPGVPGGPRPRPGLPPGLRPGLRPPSPAIPFTAGDASVLDPARVHREASKTLDGLRRAQLELSRLRYGAGPDGTDPQVRETTRIDGQWPFLLIRTYAGDVGRRPVQSGDGDAAYFGAMSSPDIIVTEAGLANEARLVDRAGIEALKAREVRTLQQGTAYDVWVHVWNLGRSQVSGVRVRVRTRPSELLGPENQSPPETFLGGTTVDLGERLSERAHCVVKAATYTPPVLVDDSETLLVATTDTLTDPASDDLSPGADRHTGHYWFRLRLP